MADAFPADDPTALWVMNLSIALGDLRIAALYATRETQPDWERLYFVRVFASHLREIAKLVVTQAEGEVEAFIATLSPEARDARTDARRMLDSHPYVHRPEVMLWRDLKRVRDDTFHYASDPQSRARLRTAMIAVAGEESGYLLDDDEQLRAEYADLIAGNRTHAFDEDDAMPVSREMYDAFVALNGKVVSFINHVEAHYLHGLRAGIVMPENGPPNP